MPIPNIDVVVQLQFSNMTIELTKGLEVTIWDDGDITFEKDNGN